MKRQILLLILLLSGDIQGSALTDALQLNDMEKINNALKTATQLDKNIALINASKNGKIELVKLLLDNGADINTYVRRAEGINTAENVTPLMAASYSGHENMVKLLLEKGAKVDARQRSWDYTALMIAVQRGYPNIVNLLIKAGADVNAHWGAPGHASRKIFDMAKTQEIKKILKDAGAK